MQIKLTNAYSLTHAHIRLCAQGSTITQEYFDRKFPNTPGYWPPSAEKTHTPLSHSRTHTCTGFRQPDEIALQSNRTINSSTGLTEDSPQLSDWFCVISLQCVCERVCPIRVFVCDTVCVCQSADRREKVLSQVTSVVFVRHSTERLVVSHSIHIQPTP